MAKDKKTQPANAGLFKLSENDLDNLGKLLSQVLQKATGEPGGPDPEAMAPVVLGVNMYLEGMAVPNPTAAGEKSQPQKEPLIEVLDGSHEVTIIAEVPGVEKKDLAFTINNRSRTAQILVRDGATPRVIQLGLPSKVNGKKASLNYTNGVMELTIPKL